ncbi:MAG: PPC domain-containing protein [Isosphaeraceae bacterium]
MVLPTPNGPTLARPFVVTPLPIAVEKDDTPEPVEKAQAVTLPAALCGRLNAANDNDTYRFEAKKGQAFDFEVVARRAGAATDPVLRVLNAKDAVVAEADDTNGLGKDCRLVWTAPSDGTFALQVGDLHSRGGDEFVYVIEAQESRPDFSLTCDPDKLNVGPGGRVPLFVQVTRRGGFNGPVSVELENLPPGVTASPLVIGPKMTQGLTVVSASKDAKQAASLVGLKGKAEGPSGKLIHDVGPKQEIYMPGGGRSTYPVETWPWR